MVAVRGLGGDTVADLVLTVLVMERVSWLPVGIEQSVLLLVMAVRLRRGVGVRPERRDAFLHGGDEDPFRTACEEVEE